MLALTNCDVISRALLKFGGDFKTGGIEKIATAICAELLARLSWQNNYLPGNIAGGSAGLREFSLALREHKTRLIEFGRFAAADQKRRGQGKPETFNFLGFTFIRRKTRAGRFLVMRGVANRPHEGQAEGNQRNAEALEDARTTPRARTVVGANPDRLVRRPCRADKLSRAPAISRPSDPALATGAFPPRSTGRRDMGPDAENRE